MINIFFIVATFAAIAIIATLILQLLSRRKEQKLYDGYIKRAWDKYSATILSLSGIIILISPEISKEDLEGFFVGIDSIVEHLDIIEMSIEKIIPLVGLSWITIRLWVSKIL